MNCREIIKSDIVDLEFYNFRRCWKISFFQNILQNNSIYLKSINPTYLRDFKEHKNGHEGG